MFHFLLLLLLLRLFAYRPVLRILDERREKVARELVGAEEARLEAERLRDEKEKTLRAARLEAEAIIARARRAAEQETMDLLAQAREETARMASEARRQLAREREQVAGALRGEVAALSVAVATRVLRDEELSAATRDRLEDEAVRAVGEARW